MRFVLLLLLEELKTLTRIFQNDTQNYQKEEKNFQFSDKTTKVTACVYDMHTKF